MSLFKMAVYFNAHESETFYLKLANIFFKKKNAKMHVYILDISPCERVLLHLRGFVYVCV